MAQILPPKYNLGDQLGQSLQRGYEDTVKPALQQKYQEKRLRDAFNKIEPGGDFLEQLKNIAPELLTTPGGAQALESLAGPLATAAQNSAVATAIKNRREGQNPPGQSGGNSPNGIPGNSPSGQSNPNGQPVDFRNPKPPKSAQNPFPEVTVGPTTQPEMSPRQIEDYALDIMDQNRLSGKPTDLASARQIALNANEDTRKYNQGIQKEKDAIAEAQKAQTQHMVERARNAGLIKNPGDEMETIISKFALDAKNAPNDEVAWEYVRTKAREAESKKNGLLRNYQVPGAIEKGFQKITGSFKEQEIAEKEAQPYLDFYRDNGLYDEARKALTVDIGLGPEDTERWLFPFDKKQKEELKTFPRNDKKVISTGTGFSSIFPGEQYKLEQGKFDSFKDNLSKFLKENPKTNLVALKGQLNRDNKYAWQDISRAMNELVAEKRFNPDGVQDSQLKVVNAPPLPGLAQQFKFMWGGTK